MSNNSHNPLSKLLSIDFPEVKKANWNTSFDLQTTADVGYCNPVFVDMLLANTHVKLDMNQAAFANPTVAPLYGRYRVKYTAWFAPHRLYIPEWRDGDAMTDDNYPYPILPLPQWEAGSTFESRTGHTSPYVPYGSLLHNLGMYPAMTQSADWNRDDMPTPSNALPLLAFWDIYRHYILNVQESSFPIRTQAYCPAVSADGGTTQLAVTPPSDTMVTREDLDLFFKDVRFGMTNGIYDITKYYTNRLRHSPFPTKFVVSSKVANASVSIGSPGLSVRQQYHYGTPIAPYGADMFTSWVSNENVELERQQSRMVLDTTDANGNPVLTMDSWILASRIQNKVRKTIFKNSDFAEYIDVQYGIKPPTDLTKPMFLGAFVSDIVFNDVISSVQGDGVDEDTPPTLDSNKNLGSRAGYGRGTDYEKHSFIEFTTQEPGTLMILQTVVPEVFYYEGRDEMYDVVNFNEEFNPAFDGVGFTPLQKSTMNLVPGLRYDPTGVHAEPNPLSYSVYNESIGQQPYGMRHMAKVNLLKGQMAEAGSYLPYSLARSFNTNRTIHDIMIQTPARGWYSSYPFPEMFTNIFASSVQDNFQFYINFDYLKYQPISKQFLAFNH